MILYSHHKRIVRLNEPAFQYDPTQGTFWKTQPTYQIALRRLQEITNIERIVWCEIVPLFKNYRGLDLVQWRVDVPFADIAFFLRNDAWLSAYKGERDVDDTIFYRPANESDVQDNHDLQCLLSFPVIHAKPFDMPIYP